MQKEITIVKCQYRLNATQWETNLDDNAFEALVKDLKSEYERYGIKIHYFIDEEILLEVGGYADLLNTVRLRSPQDHISNLCLGHVIGKSANCDLLEDLQRALSRVAFAPEMIEPEGSHKIVCHNCGCGC
ncbi:MAG: hypothetical protein JRF07_10630 [Deltaproteobacteria bacterium]|jgi:uncharacterized Rmd1/YagE family protein|nr:hypothetical protein [Deltaproteobacteria bacterium]